MNVDELVHEPRFGRPRRSGESRAGAEPGRWPRWPLALVPLVLLPAPVPSPVPVRMPARPALPAAGELPFTTVWWAAGGVVRRSPASGEGRDAVVGMPVAVDAERSFVAGGRLVAAGADGWTYVDGLRAGRGVPVRSDDGDVWLADGASVVRIDAASGGYGRRLAVAGVAVAVVGGRPVTGVVAASSGWTVHTGGVAVDRRGRRREVPERVWLDGDRLVLATEGRLRAMDARGRARVVFGSDGSAGPVVFGGRYAVFTVPDQGGLAVRAHRMGEATFSLGLRLPADAVLLGVG